MNIKEKFATMGVLGIAALYFGMILGYMAIPFVVIYLIWHFLHKLW